MGYYFDNDTFRKLNKMYEIWLNAANFKKGDVVTGKIIKVLLLIIHYRYTPPKIVFLALIVCECSVVIIHSAGPAVECA
jgi:hypothetical protein